MLDLLVVICVLIFALIGFLRGILHEALMAGALIVTYLVSADLSSPFTAGVLAASSAPAGTAYTIGRLAAGIVAFFSLAAAARIADKRIGRTRRGYLLPWNRNLGLLAGLVFGVLVAFCGLCVADAFYKAYPESQGGWTKFVGNSVSRAWVSPFNPADRLLLTDSLKLLRVAADDPDKLDELRQREAVAKLLDHPKIKDILDDPELMEAIGSRDIRRVAVDEKVRALLEDEELRRLMFSAEMREAMHEFMQEQEEESEGEPEPDAP